jgi:hypothetical protein
LSWPWQSAGVLGVGRNRRRRILTLLTDHKTGVIRVVPYWLHVAVDRFVGVIFVVVPFALGLQGLDAWYYWANGGAVLLVTLVLNAPETEDRAMKSAHA